MLDFINLVIISNFAQVVATICMHIFLTNSGGLDRKKEKLLIALMYVILAYSLFDSAIDYVAKIGGSDILCKILAIFGYVIRPLIPFSLLLSLFKNKKMIIYSIPAILNFIIYVLSLFFDKLVFWYEGGVFHRASILGFSSLITCILYLVLLILFVSFTDGKKNIKELTILVVCAIFCVWAGVIEFFVDYDILGIVSSISFIFYYLFMHVQYSKKDPTTGLFNRQTYYNYIEQNNDKVTAIMMLDMNDLKRINDTQGHEAGDKALKNCGEAIDRALTSKMTLFRQGGDEFTVVCLNTTKGVVEETKENIKKEVNASNLSIAVGYGYKEYKEPISELEKIADRNMYEDKALYYKTSGIDRRSQNS